MKYRNSTQMMADVLQSVRDGGMEGIKVTALMRKANTDHARLGLCTSKLFGIGLINEIVVDKRKVRVITEKGTMFLEEYKKFDDFAKTMGLEL